jgi:hypothetical protein
MMHNRLKRKKVLDSAKLAKKKVSDELKHSANDAKVAQKLAERVRPIDWSMVGGSGLVGGHP